MKSCSSLSNPPDAREIRRPRGVSAAAFSLVEIMVAVSLMSVIVIGLMAMFNQTQRAFRLGMNQTDVLESGRVATDMMVRELEQATPTYQSNTLNFYVEMVGFSGQALPGLQPTNPTQGFRTNVMHDLFFITRENQTWTGIGYFVRTNLTAAGQFGPVGTLYRYETNVNAFQFAGNPRRLWDGFLQARQAGSASGVSKILEGVVHFRMRTYDQEGYWITYDIGSTNTSTTNIFSTFYPIGETRNWFYSNAVPLTVELELGILERQTLDRYNGIPAQAARQNFLNNHAGNVHLFRQRIPVRNVDLSAYQ